MKQLSFNLVVLATEVKVPPNIAAALRADNINLTIESAYPNSSIKSNSIAVILVTWVQYIEMAEDLAYPLIIIYPPGIEEAVYKLDDSRIIDVVCQNDLGRLEFGLKKWVSGDVRNPQLKKITKALAIDENAERLNLVIEASNAGVWDWNIDTNEEFFSAKWCEIIGYEEADTGLKHTYNSWAERIHPDHKDSVFAALKAHLEFNTPYDVEYLHLHKSGEYRWQKSIGKALYNEIGRPIRMVGSIFDINERKKAEAALEESKENYKKSNEIQQAIISALPDLMLRISATGQYLDYHAPDHSILYRKPEDFIGKYISDILPVAVSEILMNGIKEVLDKKELIQLEYELDFEHELCQFEGRMMPINNDEILMIIRNVTERNQAVHRIKKEEERFQLMVENSNDIFIIAKPEKLHYVSPNIKKILGYTEQEFNQLDLNIAIHPDDLPQRWSELSEPGASLQFEYRIRNKQNEWRWIEAFGINLSHLESVNGMVFNLRDITEKKEKEAQIKQLNNALGQTVEQRTKELQKSEALLQEAERIAKLGSWESDLSTKVVTWSHELYEIFGLDPALPAPSFVEQEKLYEPEDWKVLNKLVQRAIESGLSYSVDLRMIRSDGTKGYLLAKGEVSKNEQGEIVRLVGIAKDITERKTAEELVRKLTNRLEQATKVSGVGVWEWNVKTNELIWNDTMYKVFGIAPECFSGLYETWESTIFPEDLPLVKKEVEMAVSGVKDFDMEFRILWPDQTLRYIKGNGTVRKDQDGIPEYMIGTNWDITESKKADELVREQRETFEFILEQSFAGYWDWAVGTEDIYVSDTYKKMLGYENEPSFNTISFLRSIIDPEDREVLMRVTRVFEKTSFLKYTHTVNIKKGVRFLGKGGMQYITGFNRYQSYFSTLEEQVSADNAVRLIDAFVDKLDLQQLGFGTTIHKSEGRPPYAPQVLLKLYLYGYLNKIRSSRKLEKECSRNIELQWLLQHLSPNYHTIADFRKQHAVPLQNMFKLYVHFLGEASLLGKRTIAVDGSKFKAVNSKKNNYNQNKIDKHQQFIADKTTKYLQELDALDKEENNSEALDIKKEKISEGLKKLKERTIKYDTLQQQLDATEDRQISTTDTDSRSILVTKAIVEVAYNVQNAVDDKHNLIVHTQATNSNDGKALHKAATQAKENLQLKKEDSIILLADKGYHTGAELQQCQQANMQTHVAYKEQPSVKHIASDYLSENFEYNKATDSYTCPAGATLTSLGTWHNKKGEAHETSYRFKTYRTEACKSCPLKNQCTKLPKRIVQRSEYQDAVDINDNNIKSNPQYYKRRQAIVEHPFGTIKRHLGYTHTLLKGLEKVNGEMNLIMFCYNFMRTKNILGFTKMLQAIHHWQPNYSKIVCAVKTCFIKMIYKQNAALHFLQLSPSVFFKVA